MDDDRLISLSIVIVNWNAGDLLRDCVRSIGLVRQDGFLFNEIIIVDNGSSDNSLREVDRQGVPVYIIQNKENRGFGAACNQGAAYSSSEYLLFLNPDTRLFQDSLVVPLNFMRQPENEQAGIASIQLLDERGHIARSCARFPTLAIFVAQAMAFNRLPGWRHLTQTMVEWDHTTTRRVDQVMGAFFLIRGPLFRSLGGFDERFFVYFEEVELSFRVRQSGYYSIYLADAQAFHAGGGTSRQVKAHRLFYSLRSRLLYGFKHFTLWRAWALLGVTLLLEPVSRSVFSLLRGGMQDIRNTLKAYGMLYRDLPGILKKTRQP